MNVDKLKFIDLGLPSGLLLATENGKDEDGNDALLSFDDAVAKYGEYMLTREQWKEVFNNCTHEWDKERKGLMITGPNGNTVFLPAAGYRDGSSVDDVGLGGGYWSSTPSSSDVRSAYGVYFSSTNVLPQDSSRRCSGFSVRLVRMPDI